MEYVDLTCDSCEPDSTADVEENEAETPTQPPTPLQAMNHRLVERQNLCANMLAASMRERERVRAELTEAQKQRITVMGDLRLVLKLREAATRNCMNAKMSLQEATTKRCALLKEIETEKRWRPPREEMSHKKQQELRERVEHMRALLHVKIRAPDDMQ